MEKTLQTASDWLAKQLRHVVDLEEDGTLVCNADETVFLDFRGETFDGKYQIFLQVSVQGADEDEYEDIARYEFEDWEADMKELVAAYLEQGGELSDFEGSNYFSADIAD